MKHFISAVLLPTTSIACLAIALGCESQSKGPTEDIGLAPRVVERESVRPTRSPPPPVRSVAETNDNAAASGSGIVISHPVPGAVNRTTATNGLAVSETNQAVTATPARKTIEVQGLVKAFESTDAITQARVTGAMTAIRDGDYVGARALLNAVLGNSRITPDQADAVRGVLAQLVQSPVD